MTAGDGRTRNYLVVPFVDGSDPVKQVRLRYFTLILDTN